MIRKVKAKRKRRNPYLVEYGYHFTSDHRIDTIMKYGLVPGFRGGKNSLFYEFLSGCKKKLIGYFYNYESPIYFTDTPSIKNIPYTLVTHFENENYNRCLKVNVSRLNQLPDLFMLHVDYGCDCTSTDNGDFAFWMEPLKYKKIKSLNKVLDKYENFIVPFYALKDDQELQSELIFLTGTFVVNERIPPKYIEEIIKVK